MGGTINRRPNSLLAFCACVLRKQARLRDWVFFASVARATKKFLREAFLSIDVALQRGTDEQPSPLYDAWLRPARARRVNFCVPTSARRSLTVLFLTWCLFFGAHNRGGEDT